MSNKYYFSIVRGGATGGAFDYDFYIAYSSHKSPLDDNWNQKRLSAVKKVMKGTGVKDFDLEMCENQGGFNCTEEDAIRVYKAFLDAGFEVGDWNLDGAKEIFDASTYVPKRTSDSI